MLCLIALTEFAEQRSTMHRAIFTLYETDGNIFGSVFCIENDNNNNIIVLYSIHSHVQIEI